MFQSSLKVRALLTGAAMIAVAGAAHAQDPDAAPAYGQVSLNAGFADDPRSIAVQAGGAIDANRVTGCWGSVSHQPSYVLNYQAGDFDLFLSAASDADSVLVVHAPNGEWLCDDDGGEGMFNPGLEIEAPASGRYAIWVGSYDGMGYEPAMLHISELGFSGRNDFSRAPRPDGIPAHGGARLNAGFADDPHTVEVVAGGEIEIGRFSGDAWCAGYVSDDPDYVVEYTSGSLPLYFSLETPRDGTIAVHTPTGEWVCDDDSAGDLNPGVRIDQPASGSYAVFAGSFGEGEIPGATLYVSELGYLGQEEVTLDWSAEPIHGSVELASGFAEDPYNVPVQAGGEVDVYSAVGPDCVGFATVEPTFDLYYEASSFDLFLSASGSEDLTMVVNAPDGSWWCDDDSAGDLNPGIRFDAPQSGLYDIWVGTYGDPEYAGTAAATLHVSELGFGGDLGGMGGELDLFAEPVYGSAALAGGFLPDPYLVSISAGGDVSAGDAVGPNYDCRGYVTSAPTFELTYEADGRPLFISVDSDTDSTLVVNAPDGSWICDDDGGAGFDAGLSLENPMSGVYDIYVGTFGQMPPQSASLHISEIDLARD